MQIHALHVRSNPCFIAAHETRGVPLHGPDAERGTGGPGLVSPGPTPRLRRGGHPIPARRPRRDREAPGSGEACPEELGDPVEGNRIPAAAVVQVRVTGPRDDEEFLVLPGQLGESPLSHVARVRLLAVNHQHRGPDLAGVGEQRLVEKGRGAHDVPSLVGIEGTDVVAARGLVVVVVAPDEGRDVLGQRIDHSTGSRVGPGTVVGGALGGEPGTGRVARRGGVLFVEVALGGNAAHVVHGGGHRGPDPGVESCGVDGHATPAADADDADPFGIDILTAAEVVDGGAEVLGVDVRGGHVAGSAARFPGVAGVESEGEESSLGHGLGVQAAGLFLDRTEGTGHGDRGEGAPGPLGPVEVGRQGDAVTVVEGNLLVVHLVAVGKNLVPFPGQFELLVVHVLILLRPFVRAGARHRAGKARQPPTPGSNSVHDPAMPPMTLSHG